MALSIKRKNGQDFFVDDFRFVVSSVNWDRPGSFMVCVFSPKGDELMRTVVYPGVPVETLSGVFIVADPVQDPTRPPRSVGMSVEAEGQAIYRGELYYKMRSE